MNSILLCTIILTYIAIPLSAQQAGDPEKAGNAPSILGSNAEGTHFIVGFMQNEEHTSICSILGDRALPRQRIAIASRYQTNVILIYPNGQRLQRQISPFTVYSFTLDGEEYECLDEGVCDKSFEIITDQPVCVYCFSSKPQTTDGYLALPISSWGTEYYSANYDLDHYAPDPRRDPEGCNQEPRGGEFAVIASEDSTLVSVWPKERTRGGHSAGTVVQQLLMKGEIWQVQDGGMVRGGSDLTGSYVSSDKPVGFLSGHVRVGVPWSQETKNHLIEMIPPKQTLGTQHIIVPYGGRKGGDIVRVITSEPGRTDINVMTTTGTLLYRVNGAGSFQELLISRPTVIETDQPVLVAHYSQSNGIDMESSFDPYMIVTTPTEQFVNSAIFQTQPNGAINIGTGKPQFEQHFVTLVVEQQNLSSVTLNGTPITTAPIVASGTVPGLNGNYSWLTIRLSGGFSYTIQGNALFGGYVYGIGEYDSYGWPVGAALFNNDIQDTNPPKLYATPRCGKQWYDIVITDSGEFDRGLSDVWLDRSASVNVDSLTDALCVCGTNVYRMQVHLIDPDRPGKARIIARDMAGNIDSIDVDLYAIKPEFSHDEILFPGADAGRLHQEDFIVTNPSSDEWIKFDSIRLKRGVEFKIVGLGSGDAINQFLTAGQNYNFTISFTADEPGVYEDTLFVYIDCRLYKIPLRATMVVPLIDTKDVDFGAIRVGRLKCLEIPVSNPGDGRLRIDDVLVDGKSGIFVFDENGVPADTIWLEPGESGVIIICFEPDDTVDFNGTVKFISNAAAGKSVANLKGRGIYPRIHIGGFDFGSIQTCDTVCTTIPIYNTGSDTAFLTGVTIAADVFVEDSRVFPHALPPGDTLWVPICFIPDGEGPLAPAPIGADNSDGLEAVNYLSGGAYSLLAELDGKDWGVRWVGSRHDTIVRIRNLTANPIRIDSIWLANGDNGDFELLTQIPPSITLGPNEDYPVQVRFTPLLRGARSVGIYASTSSCAGKVIENVLEGFGIQPLPGDELVHDNSLLNACDSRTSMVRIYNRGNAPLTIKNIQLEKPSGYATLRAPSPKYMIPVGDEPLDLEVTFNPGSYVGEISETVVWSFEELPDEEYSTTLTVQTAVQTYEISAAAPPRVDIGEEFDLFVTVDNAFWKNMPQSEVTLEISYNPMIAHFDAKRWVQLLAVPGGAWKYVGTPVHLDSNTVRLTLRPTDNTSAPLDNVTFPAIPFRGFLGNSESDTFAVEMWTGTPECVLPMATALPYSLEHICGLHTRLIEIVGNPPALKEGRPNPATTSVQIDLTLPFEGQARLELFSVDGKRIRRIIDGSMPAGDHTVNVDIRDLTNGIYYYRLVYGEFTATQPLLIRR